jgi:hypothetical protein
MFSLLPLVAWNLLNHLPCLHQTPPGTALHAWANFTEFGDKSFPAGWQQCSSGKVLNLGNGATAQW